MSGFRGLLVATWLSVLVGAAWAAEPGETATRFFKAHPNPIDAVEQGDSILFANRQIGVEFRRSAAGFQLNRLYGIAQEQDFLAASSGIFEISIMLDPKWSERDERGTAKRGGLPTMVAEMGKDAFPVGPQENKPVTWRREGNDAESTLHLNWKGLDVRNKSETLYNTEVTKGVLDVEVTVTLRDGDPLSCWRITVANRSLKYGVERVRFPLVALMPIGKAEDDLLVYPRCRGGIEEKPFKEGGFDAFYPYNFNMQFQALYNRQSRTGIYFGTHDPTPNLMWINIVTHPSEIDWRVSHFPPNVGFAVDPGAKSVIYSLPYDVVLGPFQGDWYDACQIYRQWALKQTWCRKGPLATRQDVPKWYKEAPLFLWTHLDDSALGTHSRADNLPIAVENFREWLTWAGMRLPCNWYGWKQFRRDLSTYSVPFSLHRETFSGRWAELGNHSNNDGQYPKIPALPGFSDACKSLRQEGGMVGPYVSLELFDQGPDENAPYAAEAKPYVVHDAYGAIRWWDSHWESWDMCSATPWWRERLKETCTLLQKNENVGGFYLDVMQGCCHPCYWPTHGHSSGGGSEATLGQHGLVEIIHDAVKAQDADAYITGENPSEDMIDVVDGFLEVAMASENKAPILATVYNDYIKRYGFYLSTTDPGDAFFMECATLFVEGTQIGGVTLRPRIGALSFQNPEDKEKIDFLGIIVGYYKQDLAKKFLAYGQLLRPLEFGKPSPMPMLPYAGEGSFPALMSGVFRSGDGELGVFIVNAGAKAMEFRAEMDPGRYEIPAGTAVDVDDIAPDGASRNVLKGEKGNIPLSGSLAAHGMTMFRVKPAAQP
jgi:hypothetical protein